MATRQAYDWPRSPPLAPDTASPVYPDRPIRPLPKRRLRDRLSDDAAELILPKGPTQQSLFSFPYLQPDRDLGMVGKIRGEPRRGNYACAGCAHDHGDRSDAESDDEEPGRHVYAPHSAHMGYDGAGDPRSNPPPPDSATSSADGYESFENTNNKKKRKIPQANGLGAHGHHGVGVVSAELAGMGLAGRGGELSPAAEEAISTVGSYYGSGSAVMPSGASGTGVSVSGAGRGRFGRSRGSLDRRPLAATTNGLNTSAGRLRATTYGATKGQGQPQGIISAAIANAAQQAPLTPERGNENVSLLQQQVNKTPPQKPDFTFQSDAVSKFAWPGPQQTDLPPPPPPMAPHGILPARGGVHTQATQTSPGMNGGQHGRPPGQTGQQAAGQQPRGGLASAKQDKPKKPRRLGRVLEMNARRRKIQQEYQNFHHPPRREDIWICEFCEYEDIFGVPPRALIRRYEEKDRAEQKRIAEKRRLLEKAKAKSRKGKKGTKNSKNSNSQAGTAQNQRYDPPDDYANDDDYYDDDYADDDPLSVPPTPQPGQVPGAYPSAVVPPTTKHISQAAAAQLPLHPQQKVNSIGQVPPPDRALA